MSKSQIIVTSRYLKSDSKKSETKRKNYTKYIATREGAEIRSQDKNNSATASTEKQKQFLKELLNDFPDAKSYLEYEDYASNPTTENASELISTIVERNADVIGNRQNFVGYMAMRPGAEKRGVHGLFNGCDEPITLNKVAEEVAHHPGNVWSHVISLRREDAVRLGYDNSERWRKLVMRHISDIANAQKIPLCNMKWYAAFHDTAHHPHIHMIVYSTNPKQGYLTKDGIDKIRSVFANDIFHDQLQSIYQEQTLSRDELKALSENQMSKIARQIENCNFTNENLKKMIMSLHAQLQSVNGKKVYGYLPKEIKETVDRIFYELAKSPQIAAMYEKWCDLERAKYKTYTQKEKDIPPLERNKVFQPVRNMIIRTVLQMDFPVHEIEVELSEPDMDIPLPIDVEEINETIDNSIENYDQNKLYTKWSDSYKEAHKLIFSKKSTLDDYKKAENLLLSESNNVLALYELGKLYSMEKSGLKDDEKSFEFYQKALHGFLQIEPKAKKIKPYLQYQIGMMYFKGLETGIDNQKAVEYFEKSAIKNMWSSYQLGRIYLFGADGFEKDNEKAIKFLNLSAEQGNEYAQNILDNQDKYENKMLASTVFNLFINLSRCIEDDYHRKFQSGRKMIDSKLRRMIQEKNQALGIKQERGQSQEQSY